MKNFKKLINVFLVSFIISIILEIFLFNFRTIQSLGYKSTKLDNIVYHGIKKENKSLKVIEKDKNYIELTGINQKIKNIKLDIQILNEKQYLNYKIYATDEANQLYFALPERYYYPNIEKSKYINLNLSGKTNKIRISFSDEKDEDIEFKIHSISINNKIPIDISWTRVILVLILLFSIYCFQPNSIFYQYKVDFRNKYQIGILSFTMVCLAFLFFYLVNVNQGVITAYQYSNHFQYHQLTGALAQGKVYLDIEPSEELKNMENPYDSKYRTKLTVEKGAAFEWDRAYYKGKYYVYFGVVPVLTSYLPYYLITGKMLPNYVIMYIISVLTMLEMFLFLKEIVKKFFPKISFSIFYLLFLWLALTSGLVQILGYPTTYNMPIIFSLMFSYFGLFFWLSSIKKDKIIFWRIFLGSFCMALVAGCRPQLLLGSFLAIPIFFKTVFKDRNLFSKKSWKQTILFVLPYIVVAIFLMLYNKMRFDSFFDFGANYNLTSNDMTKRGFHIDRIGLGLFYMLMQPPCINATFPFLISSKLSTNYMGTTIFEPMLGGLFATNVLLVISLFFFRFRKMLQKKNLFFFCVISVVSAFIILIFDIEGAGILLRYLPDFSWLLFLPTIFILFSIFEKKLDKNLKKVILSIMLILILGSIIYQGLTVFEDQFVHDMINTNTSFFFKWYYLFQWWL